MEKYEECFKTDLDMMLDDLKNEKRFSLEEIRFLKLVKKKRPDIAEEFPILFKGV